jgi:nitrite reductase (NADH) large subunit
MNDWRDDREILCHCRNVTAGAVRACVREHAPKRPEELGPLCRAGTGCRSCLPDLETVMRQERAAAAGRSWWARLRRLFGARR